MTDAPKFTPGPWRLVTTPKPKRTNEFWYEIVAEGFNPYEDRDLYAAAEVFSSEADAHLIAAAPGLYAALADLLSAYAEPDKQICCNGQHCGCQGSTVQQMAEHYARAALAKAREQA